MKKQPPFKIGSTLKHVPTNTIIKLERYDTQLTQGLFMSVGGGTTKRVPNFNFLCGKILSTNQSFKGLSKEFVLLNK